MVETLFIALAVTALSQDEAPLQGADRALGAAAPGLRSPLKVTQIQAVAEPPAPQRGLELSEGAGAEIAGNWIAFSADAVVDAPLRNVPLFAAGRLTVTAPSHPADHAGPQVWKVALAPALGLRHAFDSIVVDGWVALPTSVWFSSQAATPGVGFDVRIGARAALDLPRFAPYVECAVDAPLVIPQALNIPHVTFVMTVGVRWGTA